MPVPISSAPKGMLWGLLKSRMFPLVSVGFKVQRIDVGQAHSTAKWIHKSHGKICHWADVSGWDRQRCPLKPPWPLWHHGHPRAATMATMALAKRCRSSGGRMLILHGELHLNQNFACEWC